MDCSGDEGSRTVRHNPASGRLRHIRPRQYSEIPMTSSAGWRFSCRAMIRGFTTGSAVMVDGGLHCPVAGRGAVRDVVGRKRRHVADIARIEVIAAGPDVPRTTWASMQPQFMALSLVRIWDTDGVEGVGACENYAAGRL